MLVVDGVEAEEVEVEEVFEINLKLKLKLVTVIQKIYWK